MFNLQAEIEELLYGWREHTYSDLDMESVPVREFSTEAKAAVDKAVQDYMASAIWNLQHPELMGDSRTFWGKEE
tara:strand:+ start:72 stop:293 length:222 start_codon:yes stop_codon:yes gene_type:complete